MGALSNSLQGAETVPSFLPLLSGSPGVFAGLQHKQAQGFTSLTIIIWAPLSLVARENAALSCSALE